MVVLNWEWRIVTFDLISRSFMQMCQKLLFLCCNTLAKFFYLCRCLTEIFLISSTKFDACFDSTDDSNCVYIQCEPLKWREKSPWLGAIGLGFIYEPTTFYIFYILCHCSSVWWLLLLLSYSVVAFRSASTNRPRRPTDLPNEQFQCIHHCCYYNMHHLFICIYNLLMFLFRCLLLRSDWSEFNEQNMNYALSQYSI